MAFQAEQKIKTLILNTLGIEHIFRLLNDSEVNVLMKTLGLLRNLLCTKPHIDYIMNLHGNEIIQVYKLILTLPLFLLMIFIFNILFVLLLKHFDEIFL